MNNFLDKIKTLLKKESEKPVSVVKQKKKSLQKPNYDFVEEYVLVNPRKVFVNYDLFELCQEIPVSVENKGISLYGCCPAIPFPKTTILPLLRQLNKAPEEILENPLMRTVYVIQLRNNEKLYILPNLQEPKNPVAVCDNPKKIAFNVNPQINRAIVDCIKQYTRQ